VRAEKNPRLRESLIFHFVNSNAAQAGDVKKVAEVLLKELAPMPPYEKWFANGNKTVNLSWTVGQGELFSGLTGYLKSHGFKAVGPEDQGVATYEATINKPAAARASRCAKAAPTSSRR